MTPMAAEVFRFGLHCVPFQRHPCCVNQPKALANVTMSNIRLNGMARLLEGTGIPRYTRSHFTRFRYNAI